ncbi:CTP synthase [[Mycoplasma] testudinis]|uniref:CTP synthase n=1 Tax=[Mycoplasma] testudinis TaxID=33924 RepID=UPI00055A50A6|nr:CTP synthase [[Mycoplasma] testudinis]
MQWNQKTKFIFMTGGVFSSLGKGLSAASVGSILSQLGLDVRALKLDPYLNVDPGTMSPYQHGEVFVTGDGAETDLDLGHYERFLNKELSKGSSITAGKIYNQVIQNERKGKYLGKTIQVVPHVTNQIKECIYNLANETNADVILIEIGGTVGDIESLPFLEAMRQICWELPRGNTLAIHAVPVIELQTTNEVKTKPLQHSTQQLRNLGITPDFLFVRSKLPLSPEIKNKIASMCSIYIDHIFSCVDVSNVYLLPEFLYDQKVHVEIAKLMDLKFTRKQLSKEWLTFTKSIKATKKQKVKIALVGKYTELKDAYMSLYESLKIASYYQNVDLYVEWVNSSKVKPDELIKILKNMDGLVVPGGFDKRGIEGKLQAIEYARTHDLPFLGICLGMQLACVEFARNVLKLQDANSTEFDKNAKANIIDLITKRKVDVGGTLRLGNYHCSIKPNTLASRLYESKSVTRRHRHRYEFNNDYIKAFEKAGFVFSGTFVKNDLQEIIEIPKHSFFIGCQYHPEFNSTPYTPEPLFMGLIESAKAKAIKK